MNPQLKRRGAIAAALVLTLWASWKLSDDSERPVESEPARPGRNAMSARQAIPQHVAMPAAAASVGGSIASRPLSLQTSDLSRLAWPLRSEAKTQVDDIFALRKPTESKPEVVEPTAPPLDLKYVGRLDGNSQSRVFVSDATGSVSLVTAGDVFPNGWRLVSTDNGRLVFRYDAMNQEQIIPTGVFK